MAITIKLQNGLTSKQEQWLVKNIGPRLHYMHNSIGGYGWIAKSIIGKIDEGQVDITRYWTLTFEEDSYATWFKIMFPT